MAGHCPWVLVWTGACYWHGVGGFMFIDSDAARTAVLSAAGIEAGASGRSRSVWPRRRSSMPRSRWHAPTAHSGSVWRAASRSSRRSNWASAASSRALNADPRAFRSRALAISAPSRARSSRPPSRALSAVALSLQKLTAASAAARRALAARSPRARRALAARARRKLAALTSRATRRNASSSTRNGLIESSALSRVKWCGAGEPRPPRWPRVRGGGRHRLTTARGCRRYSRLSPLSAALAIALSRGGGLAMYHTPEVRGLRL